jgi:protein SCO1/2
VRRTAPIFAALLALAVLPGCSGSPEEDDVHGAVLTEPYVVPDTELQATSGEPFSLASDTDERLTLVFFGYTHCPDICQVVMSNLASAMTRLDPADREDVEVVFVTTDPARDDPQTLRSYLDRFDPAFTGLTGDLPSIVEVGHALGVAVEKGERLPSGGYEVTHGTQVVGIDPDDRAPIVWTEGTSAAQFADDVHLLLTGEV